MAVGAGGLLSGIGGAFSSMAETGVDAVKFTVEQGGKVVKAVRDDRTEIEIPGWMLGNKKGEPVKIPSQLFGYVALGLGVYVLARMMGIRPFDWLVGKMESAGGTASLTKVGEGTGVDGKVTTPDERATITAKKEEAVAAEAATTAETPKYYGAMTINNTTPIAFGTNNEKSLDAWKAILDAYKAAHAQAGYYIAKADLDALITAAFPDIVNVQITDFIRKEWTDKKGLEGWTKYF